MKMEYAFSLVEPMCWLQIAGIATNECVLCGVTSSVMLPAVTFLIATAASCCHVHTCSRPLFGVICVSTTSKWAVIVGHGNALVPHLLPVY